MLGHRTCCWLWLASMVMVIDSRAAATTKKDGSFWTFLSEEPVKIDQVARDEEKKGLGMKTFDLDDRATWGLLKYQGIGMKLADFGVRSNDVDNQNEKEEDESSDSDDLTSYFLSSSDETTDDIDRADLSETQKPIVVVPSQEEPTSPETPDAEVKAAGPFDAPSDAEFGTWAPNDINNAPINFDLGTSVEETSEFYDQQSNEELDSQEEEIKKQANTSFGEKIKNDLPKDLAKKLQIYQEDVDGLLQDKESAKRAQDRLRFLQTKFDSHKQLVLLAK